MILQWSKLISIAAVAAYLAVPLSIDLVEGTEAADLTECYNLCLDAEEPCEDPCDKFAPKAKTTPKKTQSSRFAACKQACKACMEMCDAAFPENSIVFTASEGVQDSAKDYLGTFLGPTIDVPSNSTKGHGQLRLLRGSVHHEDATNTTDDGRKLQTRFLTIRVKHDGHPRDTGWYLQVDGADQFHFVGYQEPGWVTTSYKLITRTYKVSPGKYLFEIIDDNYDGICCEYGRGYYAIYVNNVKKYNSSFVDGYNEFVPITIR
jgi:hypothetical protein